MNIKKEFIIREIAGEHLLVPTGETTFTFNGLITMNDVGAFIWNNLESAEDEAKLLSLILDEYEIDEATTKKDMTEFLEKLREAEIIA